MFILYLFSATIAFMGLLGVYYKKFRFAVEKYSKKTKIYQGPEAQIWGMLYFLFFGLPSGIIFWFDFGTTPSKIVTGTLYLISTIIALYLAFLSRKKGNFKV